MAAASMLTTLVLALAIAIVAKPVLEQKSPMKLPLTELRSLTNHNVVARDRRRLKSLIRLPRDQDDLPSISLDAIFRQGKYGVVINIGEPETSCK
jgi:hypothetical protein